MKCFQHGAYSPECFENLNLVRINFNRTGNYCATKDRGLTQTDIELMRINPHLPELLLIENYTR